MSGFPFYIAHRYLFAKKTHKVVNIISMISLFGFCIGTAALVIVLSVFNGFEGLITSMYNCFDPELKITPALGKTIVMREETEQFLKQNPKIASYSKVIEEQALLRYNGRQSTAIIKGVSEHYHTVTGIDSLMLEGDFLLKKGDVNGAVIGMGLARTLGLGLEFINALVAYAPKRTGHISISRPENSFISDYFFPTGFFAVFQPEVDNQYVLVEFEKAQKLFQYEDEISSIEIRLQEGASAIAVKQELRHRLGEKFLIKDRFEQKATLYRMLSMEKWMTFFIVIFILIIAIFNIVGTLSMLIIEKKNDIKTLQSIGASNQLIRHIFYTEGSLIAFIGAGLGMLLGTFVCILQQQFGFITLGGSGMYIVDAYPVEVLPTDLILIFITVIAIGSLSIFFPIKYICKRFEI